MLSGDKQGDVEGDRVGDIDSTGRSMGVLGDAVFARSAGEPVGIISVWALVIGILRRRDRLYGEERRCRWIKTLISHPKGRKNY